jgi:hypothetical protein
MPSIEQKILACVTELNPDLKRLRELMSYDVDRNLLIRMAMKEDLAGFLYKRLLESGMLQSIDINHKERLQSFYYQTVASNLRMIHGLKEVLSDLNQRKSRVVLLQGICLLGDIYQDIGLRPLKDIDLRVSKRGFPALTHVLGSLGYQADPVYPRVFRKGNIFFDIHTDILWADRIRHCKWLLKDIQDHMDQDSRIILFEGEEAQCLNRYDQILYLSLHALKHNVGRLIWLVDIKNLLLRWEDADWETLFNRAEAAGQEKTLSCILFLLLHMLDFQLPSRAQEWFKNKRPGFFRKMVLERRIKSGALPVWAPLLLLPDGKRWRQALPFILETLFPRPEILRPLFSHSHELNLWQLYWRRIWQLFAMFRIASKGDSHV